MSSRYYSPPPRRSNRKRRQANDGDVEEQVDEKRVKLEHKAMESLSPKCLSLVSELMTHPASASFLEPVDPIKLRIPTYFKIIKHPMDLSTVRNKLKSNCYTTLLEFIDDVRLIFTNCFTFNLQGSLICNLAAELSQFFESKISSLVDEEQKYFHDLEIQSMQSQLAELKSQHDKMLSEWSKLSTEEEDNADDASLHEEKENSNSPPKKAAKNHPKNSKPRSSGRKSSPPPSSSHVAPSATSSLSPPTSLSPASSHAPSLTSSMGPTAASRGPYAHTAKETLTHKIEKLSVTPSIQTIAEILSQYVSNDNSDEVEIDLVNFPDEALWKIHDFVESVWESSLENIPANILPVHQNIPEEISNLSPKVEVEEKA